jgi:hypothetical protein
MASPGLFLLLLLLMLALLRLAGLLLLAELLLGLKLLLAEFAAAWVVLSYTAVATSGLFLLLLLELQLLLA